MSKLYKCKTCGVSHTPPTGKGCTKNKDIISDMDNHAMNMTNLIDMISEIKDSVKGFAERLDVVEKNDAVTTTKTTASTLDSDNVLQKHVKARMSELQLVDSSDDSTDEEATRKSKLSKKSGRSKTANDVITKQINWPHYYVYRGPDRKPATYEDLSLAEFVHGYISCMNQDRVNPATKVRMLEHLQSLTKDAAQYPWESVRNFHAIVLHQHELDRLTWDDTSAVQQLRDTYVTHQPASTPARNGNGNLSSVTARFCLPYQTGTCHNQGDHATSKGPVKHMCAYCFNTTKMHFHHPENQCRKKQYSKMPADLDSKNS